MSRTARVVLLVLPLLAACGWIAGCEGNDLASCFDSQDNDGDGAWDCADPGCAQFCGDDDDDASDDDDMGDDDVGDDDLGDDDVGPDAALLIQDSAPWGYSSWSDQLAVQGIATTTIGSWSLGSTNLAQYELVITSSVQGGAVTGALNAELTDFEAYVLGGGVLVWSVCTQEGDTPYPLVPFGGTVVSHFAEDDTIAVPGHPLLAGVAPPFTGNYASHNRVASAPNNAVEILTDPTYGDPVLYTLEVGSGLLIVHGNPLEFQSADNADNEQVLANIVDFGWAYTP